ncbi:sugar kinase [Aggregatilineales bacterium SYSU G02658]
MLDLITFGETMLRLAPPPNQRLEGALELQVNVGGAESNVAVNLARLGKRTAWFSRLPANPLGYTARNIIRQHGVDVSHVVWSDDQRMGLYFVENGAPPRGALVWYDRQYSAASHLAPDDLPLEALSQARWLHLTGITAALSPTCRACVRVGVEHARKHNVTVSFDVNYRALLWDANTAVRTLTPFCEAADVVFVARRDAVLLWGAPDEASECADWIQRRWGGTVIVSDGQRGAVINDGEKLVSRPSLPTQVMDRVGAGDALAAGVICRLLEHAALEDALRFGLALAALKLSMPGDFALTTREEVETLLEKRSDATRR